MNSSSLRNVGYQLVKKVKLINIRVCFVVFLILISNFNSIMHLFCTLELRHSFMINQTIITLFSLFLS